jgi:uncharacterized protein YkwD
MSWLSNLLNLFRRRPKPVPPPPPPAPSDPGNLLSEINRARVANGLLALTPESHLQAAADWWAHILSGRRVLDHGDFAARLRSFGVPHPWISEIVAEGQRSAAECVADWLASPGHRANLLGRFTEAGAAMVPDVAGTLYFVADFGGPQP